MHTQFTRMMVSRKIKSGCACVIGMRRLICIAIPILVNLLTCEAQRLGQNKSYTLDRDHVSVWFDSPIWSESFMSNKSNQEQLINLVSGTFGTIVTSAVREAYRDDPIEPIENSTFAIALMAAEHNKNSTNKLKVVVGLPIFPNLLEYGKLHADKANSIHPGTVDTLLLHSNRIWDIGASNEWWYKESTGMLRNYSKIRGENGYQVGIIVQQLLCSGAVGHYENETGFLPEILKYVDLIVPIVQVRDHRELDAEKEHQLQVHSILDCEQRIKQLNEKVELIPIVVCNPPRNRDYLEVSSFLQCWQLMSDWAKRKDRKVIMYQAFDRWSPPNIKSVGWWRSKDVYAESVNDIFISKADEKPQVGFTAENETIMDDYTAIFFDHRVRYYPDLKFYSEAEVRSMLKLISTRFSTIMTSYMPYLLDFHSANVTWIASIVAKMNQENQNHPGFKPFKLISTFHRDDEISWKAHGYFGADETPFPLANLEKSLKVAKEANEIYPGTVSTIAYSSYETKEWGWDLNTFSVTLENVVGNQSVDVRLAILVSIDDCYGLERKFHAVSKWVNVVIVDISLTRVFQGYYTDYILHSQFREWKICAESIRSNYSHVEFQIAMACSTVVSPVTLEDVTNCWRILNEFAREEKVQTILYQAFDTLFTPDKMGTTSFKRLRLYSYSAWWKLKNKTEVNISEDSFFETIHFKDNTDHENTEPVDENSIDEINPLNLDNDTKCFSNNNSSIFITLVVALAVGCVCLAIFVLYLYYNNYNFLL